MRLGVIAGPDPGDATSSLSVRDLLELRHIGEEVGVYLGDQGTDTVEVHRLRARVTSQDLGRW